MKYLSTIIESGLFAEIRKSDYVSAYESLNISTKRFDKEALILNEEEKIEKVCIVEKGCVRGEKVYLKGEAQIIELYDPYSMFGLEAAVSKLRTSVMDYICHEDCEVMMISLNSIMASKYSREIMKVLLQRLADDNIRRINKINILAHKGLRDKILIYIKILEKKQAAKDDMIRMNMNREQLAQFLCVNRSALSNELNKMKKEGLIDFNKDSLKLLRASER